MRSSLLPKARLALVIACTVLTGEAHANGRFPNAQQLREPLPGTVVVAGTYGLLVSANSGKDFQFVCESALFGKSLMGTWLDPLLETLPDGTLLSGSLNGLRVSHDHGCSFESEYSLPSDPSFIGPAPNANAPIGNVVDVCPGYDTSTSAVALASLRAADGTLIEHRVYKSADGRGAWTTLGAPIDKTKLRTVLTIDVAPSKPSRIYLSGATSGTATLAVSDDSGASFTTYPIALDDSEGVIGAYIAAISPTDPDRVYVRVSRHRAADDGSETWDDSLLVSDDGGAHFRAVVRKPAALLGFALSPDGKTVLAGYGDPVVDPIVVADDAVGIYAATSDALAFTQRVSSLYVNCLRWSEGGLYACAKEQNPLADSTPGDFHVGVFRGQGLPDSASAFTTLLRLRDVRGPIPLASGAASECANEWDNTCPGINACASSVKLSSGALVCGNATTSSGGAGGAGLGGSGTASGGASNSSGGSASGSLGGNTNGQAGTAATGGKTTTSGGANTAGAVAINGGKTTTGTGGSSAGAEAGAAGSNNSSGCSCGVPAQSTQQAPALLALVLSTLSWRRIARRKPPK